MGNIIPKSVKCIHSATKCIMERARGLDGLGVPGWSSERVPSGIRTRSFALRLCCLYKSPIGPKAVPFGDSLIDL